MLVENLFDLVAVDVLAAGDDHVLGAIDEEEIALSVHEAEIPAAIPPGPEDGRRLLGFVPIPRHDVGATYDDLADLTWRQLAVALVEDPDVDARHGPSARAGQGAVDEGFLGPERGGERRQLGGAVEVNELGTGEGGVGSTHHFGGDGRAPMADGSHGLHLSRPRQLLLG